jgi:hypothetical protein
MSSESPYRIVYHRVTHKQLAACIAELRAAGWEKTALVEILKTAERRLKQDPNTCGEPIFDLRALDIVVSVFCIHFGTHEQTRSVFVRDVAVMTLNV